MFRRWAKLVGRPEFSADARFANDKLRGEHGELLCQLMGEWCAGRTRQECLAELERARIPAGPVYSPREALEDETVRAAESFTWMDYPGVQGQVPLVSPPITLSRTPSGIERRAPLCGEHTEELMHSLGYGPQQIEALRARGVV